MKAPVFLVFTLLLACGRYCYWNIILESRTIWKTLPKVSREWPGKTPISKSQVKKCNKSIFLPLITSQTFVGKFAKSAAKTIFLFVGGYFNLADPNIYIAISKSTSYLTKMTWAMHRWPIRGANSDLRTLPLILGGYVTFII